MEVIFFKNRTEAGQLLARKLVDYKNNPDTIVYGLTRGGVAVAKPVSKELNLKLEPLIIRKIRHPYDPEYALGAISEDGNIIGNQLELNSLDTNWLKEEIDHQKDEIAERKKRLLGDTKPLDPAGKEVIIIDDGIATGYSMLAAIRYLRDKKAKKIIVAVPVLPKEVAGTIKNEADSLVALTIPDYFLGAVGGYYDDFSEVDDELVKKLLKDPSLLINKIYSKLGSELTKIASIEEIDYVFGRFTSGEASIFLQDDVVGKDCVILSSFVPPDSNIVETLLLANTLRREKAANITLLAPYLAYMRQDNKKEGLSLAADWLAQLIQCSGIDQIVTVDLHSLRDSKFFSIPVLSLSPARLFVEQILPNDFVNSSILAPDKDALVQCHNLQQTLALEGVNLPIIEYDNVDLSHLVTPNILIVDDILDTGVTLTSVCKKLKDMGVTNIIILVTHGIFSGNLWEDLWEYNVSDIYVTDSVPSKHEVEAKGVSVISVTPLLKEYFLKMND